MTAPQYRTLDANGNETMAKTVQSSAGVADAGKIPALGDDGFLSTTFNPDVPVQNFTASETIATNAFVNLWTSTGSKVRNADASGGLAKKAAGVVRAGFASAASGAVDMGPVILSGLSGLTPDTVYFLSATTPGGLVKPGDPGYPVTAGHILQQLGQAITATTFRVNIQDRPIVLA